MIWGYDYGAQLFVVLTLLVIVLGGHFIRLYIKRKKGDNANKFEGGIHYENNTKGN